MDSELRRLMLLAEKPILIRSLAAVVGEIVAKPRSIDQLRSWRKNSASDLIHNFALSRRIAALDVVI